MDGKRSAEAGSLFSELSDYEKRGIDITLNGLSASPMQVVQAHVLREDVVYMRDYVMNDKGDIEKLCFTDVDVMQKK